MLHSNIILNFLYNFMREYYDTNFFFFLVKGTGGRGRRWEIGSVGAIVGVGAPWEIKHNPEFLRGNMVYHRG